MKIWRGQKYHEKGIKQLCDYLEINDLDKGYLVIFNFNKTKSIKKNLSMQMVKILLQFSCEKYFSKQLIMLK